MTLCEIVAKHGLLVTVKSKDPLFGKNPFVLLAEDEHGFTVEYVSDKIRGWVGKSELADYVLFDAI
jgi:hypothetical protein